MASDPGLDRCAYAVVVGRSPCLMGVRKRLVCLWSTNPFLERDRTGNPCGVGLGEAPKPPSGAPLRSPDAALQRRTWKTLLGPSKSQSLPCASSRNELIGQQTRAGHGALDAEDQGATTGNPHAAPRSQLALNEAGPRRAERRRRVVPHSHRDGPHSRSCSRQSQGKVVSCYET